MKEIKRRLPAEWEEHEATLLSFPSEGRDWPGKFNAIQWAFVEIIRKVALYEKIILLVKSEQHLESARDKLKRAHTILENVDFLICDTNRNWMRDSGPIVVQTENNQRQALQFGFTGWAKYPNHLKDRRVPETVARHLGLELVKVVYNGKPVVLEGGAIDINGCGTLVTTEECLLHTAIQVRNPGFTKTDYENIFREYMGISHVIWLGDGIEGDDTHGHVDDICRFVNNNTLLACYEPDKHDYNQKVLEKNLDILKHEVLEDGSKPEIVKLPMPGRIDFEKVRLPVSYINFLITNGCVLVPTFNDKNDSMALGIIRELFTGRDVIGINATDLVWGFGTLHCLSHEISL